MIMEVQHHYMHGFPQQRSIFANSLLRTAASAHATKSSPVPPLYLGGRSAATQDVITGKPSNLSEYDADYAESELDDFFVIDHHIHQSPTFAFRRPETPRVTNSANPGYEEIEDAMRKLLKQGSYSSSTASTSSKRSAEIDIRAASTPSSTADGAIRVRDIEGKNNHPIGVANSSSYSSGSALGRRAIKPDFCWSNLASPDTILRPRHKHVLPTSDNRSGRKIDRSEEEIYRYETEKKSESVGSAMAKLEQQQNVSRSKMSGMMEGLKSNSLRAQLLKAKVQESTTGQNKPSTPTKSSFRLISPLRRRSDAKSDGAR